MGLPRGELYGQWSVLPDLEEGIISTVSFAIDPSRVPATCHFACRS